jgi:hypothetical protein
MKNNNNAGEDAEKPDLSDITAKHIQWHSHCGKVHQLLIKLNTHLLYDPESAVRHLLQTYQVRSR